MRYFLLLAVSMLTAASVSAFAQAGAAPKLTGVTVEVVVNVPDNAKPYAEVEMVARVSGPMSGTVTRVRLSAARDDNGRTFMQDSIAAPHVVRWREVFNGDYTFRATAWDATGASIDAPSVKRAIKLRPAALSATTASSHQPPRVAFTAPSTGASVVSGASVILAADASDPDGGIRSVEFLVNGTRVGEANQPPFMALWTPTVASVYAITARATDTDGHTASDTRTLTVTAAPPPPPPPAPTTPNVKPSVSLTAPADAARVTVNNAVTVSATASDSDGTIKEVRFYANGVEIGVRTALPHSVTWTPTVATSYAITARAMDNKDETTTSTARTITVAAVATSPVTPITPTPSTNGLLGEYFTGTSLSGTPTVVRVDRQVNFGWTDVEVVAGGVGASNFSVRWTGEVVAPITGAVTFSTVSDDGVRLWVNNQALINNWTGHGATVDTAPAIQLVAGQRYPLRLEYFQGYGGKELRLRWAFAGTSAVAIPSASLFAANNVALTPAVSLTATSSNAFVGPSTITLDATASAYGTTVAKVEYFHGNTKLSETTQPPHRFVWNRVAGGLYSVSAQVTDAKNAVGTSVPVTFTVSLPPLTVSAQTKDAARFLTQATFGPTLAEIEALAANDNYAAWLDNQFALPRASHWDYCDNGEKTGTSRYVNAMMESFWKQAVTGPDQLRQRVAFALSEIMVVSTENSGLDTQTFALASYYDMLNRNAFGNFRTLLEEVSLHPAMGVYLSHKQNEKEDATTGRNPDENYAREVMQLFAIGLWHLNADGTRKIAAGKPIPTYGQREILGMAKVFTGWSWGGQAADESGWHGWRNYPGYSHWQHLMQDYTKYHSASAKEIISGVTIPANTNARASLKIALDTLFNHPNVGPFFGKQLIKKLVTSNPSPAYVARVTAAFDNNGSGVRGDMKAVIRAILLDPEARDLVKVNDPTWGKVREPIVRFGTWMRAFDVKAQSGLYRIWNLEDPVYSLGQNPFRSPSVFNFFRPDYTPPGSILQAGLVAPEFQIIHETTLTGTTNFFEDEVRAMNANNIDDPVTSYAAEMALADQPEKLMDRLNLLLLAGDIKPTTRATILDAINAIAMTRTNARAERVTTAVFLIMASPEFIVQK
jgi:uncharacterized protein (DUF1800 family)